MRQSRRWLLFTQIDASDMAGGERRRLFATMSHPASKMNDITAAPALQSCVATFSLFVFPPPLTNKDAPPAPCALRTLRRGHEHHLVPPPPEGCTIPASFFHMFETAAAAAKVTRGSTATITNEVLDEMDAEQDAVVKAELRRKFGSSVVLMAGRWILHVRR